MTMDGAACWPLQFPIGTVREKPLRVMMLGLRGVNGVQGGVEAHVEHLARELVSLGCDVNIAVRSRYTKSTRRSVWKGALLIPLWSPKSKHFEAIVHTLIGVIVAAWRRPDILHIHAIGPALVTPLARLMGLRVVVTHHGRDYDRQKWSRVAKWVLRLGESLGMRFSNARIVISKGIGDDIIAKHNVSCFLIPNGVDAAQPVSGTSTLDRFGLKSRRYVLSVGRIVPEKRQIDLIAAFGAARLDGWKIAVVGSADHSSHYTQQLADLVRRAPEVVLTGIQTGAPLAELYAHAGLFVLPSSHEGLPIVLLEALSFGLPVIASDIPANLELGLGPEHYFPVGDVTALARCLESYSTTAAVGGWGYAVEPTLLDRYDWHKIGVQTLGAYRSTLDRRMPHCVRSLRPQASRA